jgi:hypothetical protein
MVYKMKEKGFFSVQNAPTQLSEVNPILTSDNMEFIMSSVQPGAIVILDIDDTIGRVNQTLGLDAWFRFRIQQFASSGHTESQALLKTIELSNFVHLTTRTMQTVDRNHDMADLIEGLKHKGIKVIALTARGSELADKTVELLQNMGVTLSHDAIAEGSFNWNDKHIRIKSGVIFASGSNKGLTLEQVSTRNHLNGTLGQYQQVCFVDDSHKNCHDVARSLGRLGHRNATVWNYKFAEANFSFTARDIKISEIQEDFLMKHGILINDEEASKLNPIMV